MGRGIGEVPVKGVCEGGWLVNWLGWGEEEGGRGRGGLGGEGDGLIIAEEKVYLWFQTVCLGMIYRRGKSAAERVLRLSIIRGGDWSGGFGEVGT